MKCVKCKLPIEQHWGNDYCPNDLEAVRLYLDGDTDRLDRYTPETKPQQGAKSD